jgi:predicted Zn finger-like uncharacterized protein
MIIACPACATRFLVDDAALAAAAGRRRLCCANCGHVWRHRQETNPLGVAAPADAPPVVEPAAAAPAPAREKEPMPVNAPAPAAAAPESALPLAEPPSRPKPAPDPIRGVPSTVGLREPLVRGLDPRATGLTRGGPGPRIDPPPAEPRIELLAAAPAIEALRVEPAPAAPRIEPTIDMPRLLDPPPIEASVDAVRVEPHLDPPPPPAAPSALPRPSVATEEPIAATAAARRRSSVPLGLGLIALAAVTAAAAIVLFAVFARDGVMAIWPATTGVYAMLGLGGPPGAGLEVTLTPTRTTDSLVIDGDIVNGAEIARRIPRLRVALRDRNRMELVAKIIDPPVARLLPGATAHFNAVFAHPSIAATGVAVTFATD